MVSLQRGIPKSDKEQPFSVGALIMYDHDSSALVGAILGEKKGKYVVLNERNREIELQALRLHKLPGLLPADATTLQAKSKFMADLHESAREGAKELSMEEIWSFVKDEDREFDVSELSTLYFGDNSLKNHLILRVALLIDKVFFKRVKDKFIPRPEHIIDELRQQEEARRKKLAVMEIGIEWLLGRRADPNLPCPDEIRELIKLLENVAANSSHIDQSLQRDAFEFLDLATERLSLPPGGSHSDRAYRLLTSIGHFGSLTNLSLIRNRIRTEFPSSVIENASLVKSVIDDKTERADFTSLETYTIDDVSTKDMDDAFSISQDENGDLTLYIHITDVAASIEPGSQIDLEAKKRATSLYLPEQTVLMFPPSVSHEKLSLKEGEVRQCITCIFKVNESFEVKPVSIKPSLIKVRKRLTYKEVDEYLFLEKEPFKTVDQIAAAFEAQRIENGGFRVQKRDISINVNGKGEVSIEELDEAAPARALVGELMVLANSFIASYCRDNKIPIPYRVQEAPEEMDLSKIPAGPAYDFGIRTSLKRSLVSLMPGLHATLGLNSYTQATSPIRRYLDLIIQRQLHGFISSGKPHYSREEISSIQLDIEESLNAANLASRESKRYWTLKYLEQRIKSSKKIEATVVRVDGRNPLAELDEVFITLPVKMNSTPNLGAKIEATILAIDPRNDYIRLEGKVLS